ncbi:MAG: hypothetical protein C3F17_04720 [Bradyrhizobiaceae bacterium]|nr:MAG: hypothetical protein C3F17_04720 [Bradyrhizobiaceae bacterium]
MSRALALAAAAIVALSGVAMAKRVNDARALVVRGMNGTFCDPNNLGAGSDPQVTNNSEVQNLSVACSPDGSLDVHQLRRSLPNPHICWAKLEDLEDRNEGVIVSTDPLPGNPNHCLVRDITPNQMIRALHYRP